MNKLNQAQMRTRELIGDIGDGIRSRVPDKALQWLEAGAAIGVAKTGAKATTRFVRRHPVLTTAVVVGAGLLWFAARQQAKKRAALQPIDGNVHRLGSRYVAPAGEVGDDEMGV